ncbi:hypothetical protein ACJRPK_00020 [Aquimarina sp. 2-A2]|uniref:hypothetical protein n=1 Tax=Aquimarina sp. 2-A2 TaxID=3382644 RepID=UPI00387F1158
MTAYLIIIEIILLVLAAYESYRYYIFKYMSYTISAMIKEIEQYEVFQRPSNKMLVGEKRAIEIMLEYEVDGKKYTKKEKITENQFTGAVGDEIQLLVVKNQPSRCSLKPHLVRKKRMIVATAILMLWSILSYIVFIL